MKILQVTSSLSGGAGISANLLHQGLKFAGHESILISRQSNFHSFKPQDQFLSRVNTVLNEAFTRRDYVFTSPASVQLIDPEYLLSLESDVIHIHNWYNMLSWHSIERLISTGRVVLTMHDSRLLSGGCHVLLGCKNYLESCNSCPAVYWGKSRIRRSKQEIEKTFRSKSNFRVITPSKWLAREFRATYESTFVHTIENLVHPVFQQAFKPRTNIGLKKILFVASNLDAPFKGLRLLVESLNILALTGVRMQLTVVGNGSAKILEEANFEVICHSEVSAEALVKIYHENHLLVVPSLSDNFPGVVREAQLCGIPVLGTDVGGIGEMIVDGKTGFLCSPNVESLIKKLMEATVADLSVIATEARKYIGDEKSNDDLIAAHLGIYDEI